MNFKRSAGLPFAWLGVKYLVFIYSLGFLLASNGVVHGQRLNPPVMRVAKQPNVGGDSACADLYQRLDNVGHILAMAGVGVPECGVDDNRLWRWLWRLAGIYGLLFLLPAVIRDLYADISQEQSYKCRKWLPVWLTGEPHGCQDTSNDCTDALKHGMTPNDIISQGEFP